MMIRKSGLIIVVIIPLAMAIWLYLSRNAIVAGVTTYALERMLGTPVRISGVSLQPFQGRSEFGKLQIASKEAAGQSMLQAGPARLQLNGLQLFARKLVVSEMRVDGLGFGMPCGWCTPPPAPPPPPPAPPAAAPGAPAGSAPAAGAPPAAGPEDGGWSLHIPLPELNLDALEQKLDVGRITSGQKLQSMQTLDQVQQDSKARIASLRERNDKLNAKQRLDAIKAQVDGLDLSGKDPVKLQASLAGLKDAIAKTKALQAEVQGLAHDVQAEPGRLKADYAKVNRELDADVASAMRLAHLGGLNVSQIGELVFGPVVLERFNWVLAQVKQVRGMLSSDGKPPAKPPRRVGRFINFPVTGRAYPGFLVETTAFSGSAANPAGGAPLAYTGKLTGLSSDARVYGQPMLLEATAQGAKGENWVIHGTFDHRESPGKDSIVAKGQGVRLSDVKLSGGSLPERAVSKDADVTLEANLRGFSLEAALRVQANGVTFQFAPGTASSASQQAMREVFAGLDKVRLEATLGGTLRHPKVHISSSIDQQLSQRLNAVVGKRRAAAEAQIRAQLAGQVEARQAEVQKSLQGALGPLQGSVQDQAGAVQAFQAQLDRKQAEAQNAARSKAANKVEDLKKKLFSR